MKKLKLLLPLVAIAAASGVALPIVSCGCSNTTTYDVAIEGNATIDNTQAEKGKEFKGVITAKDTFALVAQGSIKSVKVGSTDLVKDTDYTWDGLTSTITIVAEKVTGDITISVETGKQAVVEDEEDFIDALEDEAVAEIDLPEDGLDFTAEAESAMSINRTVTIAGTSSTEKTPLVLRPSAGATAGAKGLTIGVESANADAGINVTLKNLDITYLIPTTGYARVVNLEDITNSNVNIVNTNINYIEGTNAYIPASFPASSYGLFISPKNILGGTINIENSNIAGYGAIYNQGSNIKLTANNSKFEGYNFYPGDVNQFTTITVADNPLMPDGRSRSFSANNEFTFNGCTIVADDHSDSSGGDDGYHQTIAEIQSIANNHLYLNDTDCITIIDGDEKDDDIAEFIIVFADNIIGHDTTEWLKNYSGDDKPEEIDCWDAYCRYYLDEKLSSINIDDKPATTEDNCYCWSIIEDESGNVVWESNW